MKKINVKTMLLFFIILAVPLSGQGQNVFDPTTQSMIDPSMKMKIDLPSGPRQYTVLWDTTHGVHLLYSPNGRYSNLADILVDSGFTIVMNGQGVNNIDLSPYDIIVINIASSWNSAYTGAEVNALVSWYDNGHQQVIHTSDANWCDNSYMHLADDSVFSYNVFEYLGSPGGILIMSENTACPNANVAPVVQAFNMNCGLSYLSPSDLYFSNFAAHAIYNNVSQVYYRAAGELSASAPAQEIGWTSTNQGTVAEMNEAIGIELMEFLALPIPGGIRLRWRTGYEIGNAAWRIQRRYGKEDWGTLANIPAMENSPHGNSYRYDDVDANLGPIYQYRLGAVSQLGIVEWLSTIQVDPQSLGVDLHSHLRIHPNPFRSTATIRLTLLPGTGYKELRIVDMAGRRVRTLALPTAHSLMPFEVTWDARDERGLRLGQGVYFVTIVGDGFSITRSVLLLE